MIPWEHRIGWFVSTRACPYADGPRCCTSGGQTSSESSLTLPSCQGGNRFPGTTTRRCSVSLGRLCAVPARDRLTNLLSFSRCCQTALLGRKIKDLSCACFSLQCPVPFKTIRHIIVLQKLKKYQLIFTFCLFKRQNVFMI